MPVDASALVPLDGSNNTGEMKAVIELFDFILYYPQLPIGSEIKVFIDSQYVVRCLLGDQLPSTHHQLAELVQQYFTALRTVYFVQLIKVSSHIGIPGNELADVLANRGVSSYGTIGRFSTNPTTLFHHLKLGITQLFGCLKHPRNSPTLKNIVLSSLPCPLLLRNLGYLLAHYY